MQLGDHSHTVSELGLYVLYVYDDRIKPVLSWGSPGSYVGVQVEFSHDIIQRMDHIQPQLPTASQVLTYIAGWSIALLLIDSQFPFCFRACLVEERKKWCKNHPSGFWARPTKNSDSTLNMMLWEVRIPGKKGVSRPQCSHPLPFPPSKFCQCCIPQTDWAGRIYKLQMIFLQAPKMQIYPTSCSSESSGTVSSPILNHEMRWEPVIILEQPYFYNPAQIEGYSVHKEDPDAY
ncbi:uncharacterized protein MELLADRAFT_95658 [Melampsora larici-populina 98AG31]|uniref:Uncharacterized protein n=1 Tax=Melampsora larici-populina (strain 98AG31 / pathotype 3-4-7) TaxID=747676 RepID=F4SA45_MELLP|nr:uncharacterized protein MELLADRAFT_95658 [Melampsora larici-populina 98AG31]EGF98505.1 hypothetical protein MELLADRAFT_95658 [Melampsora larici-populina 98AG31]